MHFCRSFLTSKKGLWKESNIYHAWIEHHLKDLNYVEDYQLLYIVEKVTVFIKTQLRANHNLARQELEAQLHYANKFVNHGPNLDAQLRVLEEYIENFVEDKRAIEKATRILEFEIKFKFLLS